MLQRIVKGPRTCRVQKVRPSSVQESEFKVTSLYTWRCTGRSLAPLWWAGPSAGGGLFPSTVALSVPVGLIAWDYVPLLTFFLSASLPFYPAFSSVLRGITAESASLRRTTEALAAGLSRCERDTRVSTYTRVPSRGVALAGRPVHA